jgi:hypothetical protein
MLSWRRGNYVVTRRGRRQGHPAAVRRGRGGAFVTKDISFQAGCAAHLIWGAHEIDLLEEYHRVAGARGKYNNRVCRADV